MIKIRRAESGDIPALENLLYQVEKIHYELRPDIFNANVKKYSTSELNVIINDYSTPVFVAVGGENRVLGYAFCVFTQTSGKMLKKSKALYIDDLCVNETERGQRVGTQLYEYVLGFAKANGCDKVTLNVWAGNDKAMRFYEKMGLTPQKITMEKLIK